MLTPDTLKKRIEDHLPHSKSEVSGDGAHFEAYVISEAFEHQSRIKRQQLVYAALTDLFASGELHAFSLKTFTPAEWETHHG